MPALTVLVDGYNVLHRDQVAVRLPSLEAARALFVSHAGTFTYARPVREVVLVFDAASASVPSESAGRRGGVTILFAAPDADSYLQERLRACRDPRQVLVVSDDRAIRDTARACGVERMSAETFLRHTNLRAGRTTASHATERLSSDESRRITDELRRHWHV